MKRPGRIQCRSLIRAAVFTAWIAASSGAFGGGREEALLKPFMQSFPTASRAVTVEPDFRMPRSSQMVEIHNGELLLGYGVTLKVTSRSGNFRMLVAVSPEAAVLDVQVPNYPHTRGRGVRKQSFLEQFAGFSYGEPLRLEEQVDGVSGATSSATAVTAGVRQALIIVHRYVGSS